MALRDAGFPAPATSTQSTIGRRHVLGAGLAAPFLSLASPVIGATLEPRPYSARIVQSGHSLTDPIVPELVKIVLAMGGVEALRGTVDASTVPGSPMDWRWDKGSGLPPDARANIDQYDVLVITERAPIGSTMRWHKSEEVALKWFEHAWKNGNGGRGAETILYASWVDVTSGPGFDNVWDDDEGHLTFRERMAPEMARWQQIADYVNKNRSAGSPVMPVIAGPLVMTLAHDEIVAGLAPGLTAMSDLFLDNIHVNDRGAFLIALAHFAVIYRQDPMTVPERIGTRPGLTPDMTAWMQTVVARALRDYPDAGLGDVL